MGINASNHRRTLSNISSTSSNVNSGFRLDSEDEVYQFNNLNLNNTNSSTPNRMRVYENIPFATQFQQHQSTTKSHYSPNDIHQPNIQERPMTLSFEPGHQTKFRSSLKKHTVTRTVSSGTPTNPTPPDSLTSDDSSYLSARDSSISSQSRVRFSPETLLDVPSQGQNLDSTTPLQAAKRMSRRMTHSSGGETSS